MCFNLCQQFFTLLVRARPIEQFCNLITGKDNTLHIIPGLFAVLGDIGSINGVKKPLAFFQSLSQLVQEGKKFFLIRDNVGKLLPSAGKINAALEISYIPRLFNAKSGCVCRNRR